jgi:hypothetical protein
MGRRTVVAGLKAASGQMRLGARFAPTRRIFRTGCFAMPNSEDDIKEIRAMVAVAKRGPVNIGICLGKSPEGTIIKMDRRRNPDMLAKLAKADGETNRTIAGQIEISGTDATITCEKAPPSSFAKLIRSAFKDIAQVTLKVSFAEGAGG